MGRVLCGTVALWTVLGCGGARPPASQHAHAEIDDLFAAIQVHEAAVDTARDAAIRSDRTCPARCKAVLAGLEHGEQLCALAANAADADASARCERARRIASASRAEIAAACPSCGGHS